jgi:hypothetical protein
MKIQSGKICAIAIALSVMAGVWTAFCTEVKGQFLVKVIVSYQEYDSRLPWRQLAPGRRSGYGIMLSGGRFLTTERLVRNHTLVQIQKPGSGVKVRAMVEIADWQLDLALLRTDEEGAISGLMPVELATSVVSRASVKVVQCDESDQPQVTDAEVVRIAVDQLPDVPASSLIFDVLTTVNVNGESAAVLHENKLAGVFISYDTNTRTGKMLPYCVLKRFLDDADNQPYEGVASAGFLWSPLVDPVKRRFLGVKEPEAGIIVLSCVPYSGAAEVLKSGDVILEWDGHSIDNLGYYKDEQFGKLAFSYLTQSKRPGEKVDATIIRDKETKKVSVPLSHIDDQHALVPEGNNEGQVEYLVEGGMVLRELTGYYLKAYGNWERNADSRLVHLYRRRKYAIEKPGDRVVILSLVLPDAINIGYQSFRDEIVTAVNGKPVRNMADVFRIVDNDGGLHRLTLKDSAVDLILDLAEMQSANARLQKVYQIPSLRYQKQQSK